MDSHRRVVLPPSLDKLPLQPHRGDARPVALVEVKWVHERHVPGVLEREEGLLACARQLVTVEVEHEDGDARRPELAGDVTQRRCLPGAGTPTMIRWPLDRVGGHHSAGWPLPGVVPRRKTGAGGGGRPLPPCCLARPARPCPRPSARSPGWPSRGGRPRCGRRGLLLGHLRHVRRRPVIERRLPRPRHARASRRRSSPRRGYRGLPRLRERPSSAGERRPRRVRRGRVTPGDTGPLVQPCRVAGDVVGPHEVDRRALGIDRRTARGDVGAPRDHAFGDSGIAEALAVPECLPDLLRGQGRGDIVAATARRGGKGGLPRGPRGGGGGRRRRTLRTRCAGPRPSRVPVSPRVDLGLHGVLGRPTSTR